MNVIHIINKSAQNPGPFMPFEDDDNSAGLRAEQIVDAWADSFLNADIFLISADYCCEGCPSGSFGGIRILKLLRLKGFRQHCVVYSPFPITFLLDEKYYHEILLSRGTTYIQLPAVIDEILVTQLQNRFCEADLTLFFAAEANALFRTKRHSLANWWGVLRLYEILNSLGMIPPGGRDGVAQVLEKADRYQGRLMYYARFHGMPPKISKENFDELTRFKLQGIRNKGLRTVYIDDQASDGWSYLLQCLLYGGTDPERFFTPEIPVSVQDFDILAGQILEKKPELVILDIRLFPEDEQAGVDAISGITLLRKLVYERDLTCPILVFTASDKSIISAKAIETGADAVWTKEGMDEGEHLAVDDYVQFSADRFRQLVDILFHLGSFDYSSLYAFLQRVYEMRDSQTTFWWEQTHWFPDDTKQHHPVERKALVSELFAVAMAHKQFLLSSQPAVQQSIYDMLTIKLCRTLEMIHPWNFGIEKVETLKNVVEGGWPYSSRPAILAADLVKERNAVVHRGQQGKNSPMIPKKYRWLTDRMMDYLTLDTSGIAPFDRVVGTLFRKVYEGSEYYGLLDAEGRTAYFPERDYPACSDLLQGADRMDDIEAVVVLPYCIYEFYSIAPLAKRYDRDRWWYASFSLNNQDKAEVRLYLDSVSCRTGVSFEMDLSYYKGDLTPGTRLFFFLECSDPEDGSPCCRIFDVHDDFPAFLGESYWSGTIEAAQESKEGLENRLYIIFSSIFPPKRDYFLVSRPVWDEKVKVRYGRIGFRPDWVQERTVANPVRSTGKLGKTD